MGQLSALTALTALSLAAGVTSSEQCADIMRAVVQLPNLKALSAATTMRGLAVEGAELPVAAWRLTVDKPRCLRFCRLPHACLEVLFAIAHHSQLNFFWCADALALSRIQTLQTLDMKLPSDVAAAIALRLPALRSISMRFWQGAQAGQLTMLPDAAAILAAFSGVTTLKTLTLLCSTPMLLPGRPAPEDPRFDWLTVPSSVTVGACMHSFMHGCC